jgi:PAS domain S-box-containing protein
MKPSHAAATHGRWPVVAFFVVIVALQLVLAVLSIDMLSSARAYVAGESLYSKGQKDAHIHLLGYLDGGREADHDAFLRALAVPLGDRAAREALLRQPPAIDAARHGFIAGGNHADDVAGMTRLFLWFGHIPFMARPIRTWTEADVLVQEMLALARQARARITAGDVDADALATLRRDARALNERLSALEVRFSEQLGDASRQTRALLVAMNTTLAVLLALTGLAFVRYSAHVHARSQAAVHVGDLRVARLVDAVADGVVTLDAAERIVFCNRAAETIFGMRSADAMGQQIGRFIDLGTPPVLDVASTGMAELTGRRADATTFPIEASISRLETDAGPLTTIVLRDVTEQHGVQRERRAREALEAASRAKTEFLSRMSHELRTPLNAVLGFAQLLRLDREVPPTHAQLERIDHIENAGAHLLALVNDVLDLSRVEAGQMVVALGPVELCHVVAEAFGMLESLAQEHAVSLCLEAGGPAAPPVWVAADCVRLRQVVVNLLSNAIKYNRPGGAVTLSCRAVAGAWELKVIDTGRGIAAAQLHHLFEPFNRLGAEGSGIEGTGIGLVLSRRLVELMQGTLTIDSEVGLGTTATVLLQAAPASPTPGPAQQAVGPSRFGGLEGCLDIVYAEDDEVNAELVRQMLARRSGVTLRVAGSGAQALRLVRERLPDLMLVDMNLGDMTGLQLGQQLRAHHPTWSVPLVALSADALPEQIAAAMAAGFAHYLTKPVHLRELLTLVDGLAEGSVAAGLA